MTVSEKPESLAALVPERLTGKEHLLHDSKDLPLTVQDFWQWSASDLLSNLTRGRLAEFIVAHALGIDVKQGVRNEWGACDLRTEAGINVEVKASAYLQSWGQRRLSTIGWRAGPTREWLPATNQFSPEVRWQADAYVFALFDARKKGTTRDPLDVAQWRFFVVPGRALRAQTRKVSLTLQAVKRLGAGDGVGFDGLAAAVHAAHQVALEGDRSEA